MDTLESHDRMRLNAAVGWLGLGNPLEAEKELEQITPSMRLHPDVLEVRYDICAMAKRWKQCADVAETIVERTPNSLFGWIRRSFALHELKSTKEALEKLRPAAELWPDDITIRYNLACYECVLGNASNAILRLAEAFNLARRQRCFDQWRLAAAGDPDLKPLWDNLEDSEI